ncbi:methylmalonyl-CoA epimerase [Flexistipes sinusarabici DSM 4947]|uniref:Methylmalonyl-CoA epimerase n=2 Tax=Flexistipes sinusarabici TaxID=2352 RepID=F8E7B7_FLESM|nr:methylmalonyl-CoA epimerase [Flexistipes sinusarabici]AEI13832.1 methylmalonyl-CoA epimerase [Flexistipes sinusarabici DSM 4947]HCW92129.1 methylmalonyl-CoA epimerase [Flexistipes sinusarabici]
MLKKIDHIGIAVKSLEEAVRFYETLGVSVESYEEVTSQKVKVAFIKLGDSNVELLEPTSEDSPVAKFLEKKGEGIHHLCYEVNDVSESLDIMKKDGMKLINEEPIKGAHGKLVAFVHPKSANGVLTELSQPAG